MRIETTSSAVSLFLCCALATVGACGDDGSGGGTPAASSGTDSDNPGTTADPPNPTGDPDTTAGPGSTTSDPPTTGEPDTDDPPPLEGLAFRFNSLNLRDPVAGIGASQCDSSNNIHVDTVNGGFNTALNMDDRAEPDGFNDLGFGLVFPELDQGDGATGMVTFANAQCQSGGDPLGCTILPGSQPYPTMYTAMGDGTCLAPDPANTNPAHDPPAPTTSGNCFVTEPQDVIIVAGAFALPLADARIAAQFVGDPAGNLVSGSIQGFVSQADADATDVEVPGAGITLPLASLLCPDDLDAGGWWMHLEFTAVTATWEG
ncbi:MAG: hypothetical protein K0V04_13025 [Deltaproteobacteria bacterium]|nr:hypothetical protein [Deltaproteobacteria bacterium]